MGVLLVDTHRAAGRNGSRAVTSPVHMLQRKQAPTAALPDLPRGAELATHKTGSLWLKHKACGTQEAWAGTMRHAGSQFAKSTSDIPSSWPLDLCLRYASFLIFTS